MSVVVCSPPEEPLRMKDLISSTPDTKGLRKTHLEGYNRNRHHAKPDHGQRVLPSEEARVEETDTGNHDPYESGGCEDPGNIAEVIDTTVSGVCVEPL